MINKFFGAMLMSMVVLAHISCENCYRVQCPGSNDRLRLQLMRNGQNAIFGQDAVIARDSIQAFILIGDGIEKTVRFHDETESISFLPHHKYDMVMVINGINSDTFSVTRNVTFLSECCKEYSLRTITRNGELICTDDCTEILQIEI